MKKRMTWILAGLLSLGCALIAQAASTSGDTEKAVTALEQKWAKVQTENNTEQEAALLADNYVAIGPDGRVLDRAQFVTEEKATKFSSANVEEIKVAVYGDTAIARTLMRYKGTDPKGKPMDTHSRWTDTWVKMPSGEWQCVASHGSDVKTK